MAYHPEVMISSTARDLPDHRHEAEQACLRQGMFPIMMEHLPASDEDAIAVSMAMVDKCDFYIGILGFRYGYVPDGADISITEMEFRRAREKNIPILFFLMDEEKHPLVKADVETGEGADKLTKLREELEKIRVVNYFTSPAELGMKITHTLSTLAGENLAELNSDYVIPDVAGAIHTSSLAAMLKPDQEDYDSRHYYERIIYEAEIAADGSYGATITFRGINQSDEPSDFLLVPFVVLGAPGRMNAVHFEAWNLDTKSELDVSDPRHSLHPRNCDKLMLRISMPEVAPGAKFAVKLRADVKKLMWMEDDYDAVGLKRFERGVGSFSYQLRSELKPVQPRCYSVQWGGGLKRLTTKYSGRKNKQGRYLVEPRFESPSDFELGIVCHYRALEPAKNSK